MEPEGQAPLSDADYLVCRDFVRRKSGLEIPKTSRRDLENAVLSMMPDSGCASPGSFLDYLDRPENGKALEGFISLLTVGETHFFRNMPQMNALEFGILPEILDRRRETRRLRIWSAGCSSGEEAYSLAILLKRILPDIAEWKILILATDINRESLLKGRAGIYGAWSFRNIPEDVKREWFTSSGRRHELLPVIRRMVTFAHLNLVEDLYPSPLTDTIEMDLILCRNVTIYFNQETTRRVVDRLHSCLADGGWLMVGHSEPCMTVYDSFETVDFPDTMAYRKPGRKPANAYESEARIGTPIAAPRLEPPEFPEKWPERGENLHRESLCGTSPDAVSARAILLAKEGRQGEAIESLSRQEEREAENPRSCCLAARILLDRLDLDGAEVAIRRAIRLSPLSGEAHYLLGLLFQERGDREAAIENFRGCLYADPGFVLGHFALAISLDSAGQTRRAMKSLQNVLDSLEGRPDDAPIPGEEGLTVSRLRDLAKARKELMRP